ncbi:MAG: hypothetical protein M0P11_08555 [Anaerolineaceae bacterium]|nr:hypothetical protein [Anaerolineaceae bacterium]
MDHFDQEPIEERRPQSDPSDRPEEVNWTQADPTHGVAEEGFSQTKDGGATYQSEHDEEWAEKSLDEVKAGLRQISNALKNAFEQGKNDPKIKQFGEDVKAAFETISDDISDIFKRD